MTTGVRFRCTGQQLIGGLNLYAYVGNNPINYYDPSGLSRVETEMLAGGIAQDRSFWNNPGRHLPSLNSSGWNTLANTLTGVGDGVTLGLTRKFRDSFDKDSINVGDDQLSYRLGNLGGIGVATDISGG